jgi:hypothetical protein
MTTEVVKIVDPDLGPGADYDSLYDWEAAQQGDLTGVRDEIAVAKCRCTGGTADTTKVEISGWTTSATQYIKIWTDPSESYRHNGTYQTGNKFRLEIAPGQYESIYIYHPYVLIDGIQLYHTGPSTSDWSYGIGGASVNPLWVKNCIFRGYGNSSSTWNAGVKNYGTIYIINCLFFDYSNSSGYAMISRGPIYAYNCTIQNCDLALWHDGYSFIAKNCLIDSCPSAVSGPVTTSYCAASNAAGLAGTGDRNSQTFAFVDAANDNFHLASNDTGALGYGTNLYNDANYPFQTDIDGQDRGGSGATWDIGADQYVAISGVIAGSTCWGHSTGVTQDNIRTFASNWTGTGAIENSGDAERIVLSSGQYMESETVNTGADQVSIALNVYAAGDPTTIKYRTGATQSACESAGWNAYSAAFLSSGYVQIRIEA